MSTASMVRLRDLGEWAGGNTPSKANADYRTNGTVPWVSPKDMKVDEITSSEDRITKAALKEGRVALVPEGSVLFVTRSGIKASGLQVLFALICHPEWIDLSYREIAQRANVAHGTAGWVMAELPKLGFMIEMRGKRRLFQRERLLQQWAEFYPRTLRPRLLLGRYQAETLAWQRGLRHREAKQRRGFDGLRQSFFWRTGACAGPGPNCTATRSESTVMTHDEYGARLARGDGFVRSVAKGEKIWLKGGGGDLAKLAEDRPPKDARAHRGRSPKAVGR